MTDTPKKKRTKSDNEKYRRRIQAIWNWIAQGYTTAQIRHSIVTEWGLGESMAYKYTKSAQEYAKKEIVKDVGVQYAFHMETRLESLRSLKSQKEELINLRRSGAIAFKDATDMVVKIEDQILKTLADIAKLDGSYSPTKTDITTKGEAVKQVYRLPDGSEIVFD